MEHTIYPLGVDNQLQINQLVAHNVESLVINFETMSQICGTNKMKFLGGDHKNDNNVSSFLMDDSN